MLMVVVLDTDSPAAGLASNTGEHSWERSCKIQNAVVVLSSGGSVACYLLLSSRQRLLDASITDVNSFYTG